LSRKSSRSDRARPAKRDSGRQAKLHPASLGAGDGCPTGSVSGSHRRQSASGCCRLGMAWIWRKSSARRRRQRQRPQTVSPDHEPRARLEVIDKAGSGPGRADGQGFLDPIWGGAIRDGHPRQCVGVGDGLPGNRPGIRGHPRHEIEASPLPSSREPAGCQCQRAVRESIDWPDCGMHSQESCYL
jgi:hypothetical protein